MLGELDHDQIDELLRSEAIARLGCHADGRTYVVPVTYVYDGDAIVGHTSDGLKIEMLRRNPAVCVEVDHVDDLASWRSVIAWGRFEELHGDEAHDAMQLLMDRLAPRMASATAVPTHGMDVGGRALIVYRVRLEERTGRFESR